MTLGQLNDWTVGGCVDAGSPLESGGKEGQRKSYPLVHMLCGRNI